MKNSRASLFWLCLMCLALLPWELLVRAATGDPEPLPTSPGQFWTLAISAVTPMIVWSINWFVPRVPKWVLPTVTPFVGILLGMLMNWLGDLKLTWLDMAQAGALAVFIREVFNQTVTKRLTESASKTASVILLVALLPLGFYSGGCVSQRSLDPAGVYAGDSLLWQADGLIVDVDQTLTDVEALAARNPQAFAKPELQSFLAKVKAERDGVPKPDEVLTNLIQLRDAYAVGRSSPNATALQKSIVAARAFLAQARAIIPAITNH